MKNKYIYLEKKSIDRLEELIQKEYLETYRNIEYKIGNKAGEIDYLGRNIDNTWDIYEVKIHQTKKSLNKAKEQLDRAFRSKFLPIKRSYIYFDDVQNLFLYRSKR